MAIANPVYANAAYSAAIAASSSPVSLGVSAGTDSTLLTAAQNFAIAVDSAIVTAQGSAYDNTVSASAGVTIAGSAATAAQVNALTSKPELLERLCEKALGNAYQSSGGQTPTSAQYATAAAEVAASFKAAIAGAGWTTT